MLTIRTARRHRVTVAQTHRIDQSATIDPTARIDPSAVIGPHCRIEAGAFIGPRCIIGAHTRLRPFAVIVQDTELGERNDVHSHAVLGGDPQDRAFNPEVSTGKLIIGNDCIFREGVTISRGTGDEVPTRIGSSCYFMAASHAGHNVQMGSFVTLANAVLIAGHARIGDRVNFGGGAVVHQFTHIGEMAMFQGISGVSMHVPPYCVVAGVNTVVSLNTVGMRRAGFTPEDRERVKTAFRLICADRSGVSMTDRVAHLQAQDPQGPAKRFVDFVRDALAEKPPRARGICAARARHGRGRTT